MGYVEDDIRPLPRQVNRLALLRFQFDELALWPDEPTFGKRVVHVAGEGSRVSAFRLE